jgi:hypothetical protein
VQFKGYGEDAVSSFLVHESDEKGRIREEINANIRSEYTNASIPDPSIYVETGVDAFVYEDDNMFAEDDFDEDMLSFVVDLSLMNGVTDLCACPVRCDVCVTCNPLDKRVQQKRQLVNQEAE